MRLLKIGRDSACDIVLHSNKVSLLHAEITLLNSGDMMLEDKGSLNGTYIMNQPIKPNKPVKIRRGDAIRFADVELQWNQIPMPEDNTAYKAVYGIGSHFNNDFQVSGATVSRYHATVKIGRDGKVYIIDHSKNGTTIDGQKIISNTPFIIKKKSAIVCGGVPVDISRIYPPVDIRKYILGIAASVIILVGIVAAILLIPRLPSLTQLEKATACVIEQYYIEVTFKDDPFVNKLEGWPEKWIFGIDRKSNSIAMKTLSDNPNIGPFCAQGTAFFISKNGELGTNRHIACPWKYLDNDTKDAINQLLISNSNKYAQQIVNSLKAQAAAQFFQKYTEGKATQEDRNTAISNIQNFEVWQDRIQRSGYEISGSFDYLGIVLTGQSFTTVADLKACQVIAESNDENQDVALIRLNTPETPKEIVSNGFFDIEQARVDETTLKPQEEELTTIGFPAQYGTGSQIVGHGKAFLPTVHRTYISIAPDENMFQMQSNVVGGQSGSPIVDSKRRLVGIVWGSHRGTEVAYGCNIKHLKELYDKHKIRK